MNNVSSGIVLPLCDLQNNATAVEEQYWLLKKILQEHVAVEPSEEIERWYQNWSKMSRISSVDVLDCYFIYYGSEKDSA